MPGIGDHHPDNLDCRLPARTCRLRGRETVAHEESQQLCLEAVRSRIASVQPRELPASSLSARRCSALMIRRTFITTARHQALPAPKRKPQPNGRKGRVQ